jgi:NADPH:quinone reductase-like Zn-dependent oxidoreductase
MGLEVSGIIRNVGPGVNHVAIGDSVVGFSAKGCFSTRPIISALTCVKIPDVLSLGDAASIPGVFVTAIYSLLDVAQLEAGQVSNFDELVSKYR